MAARSRIWRRRTRRQTGKSGCLRRLHRLETHSSQQPKWLQKATRGRRAGSTLYGESDSDYSSSPPTLLVLAVLPT